MSIPFFWLGHEAEAIATALATQEQLERERLLIVEEVQDYE